MNGVGLMGYLYGKNIKLEFYFILKNKNKF